MARDLRFDGLVAYVPLTKGLEAVIDANDAQLVEGFNWFSQNTYAARSIKDECGRRKILRMHNLILGTKCGFFVDHINRNTLDNRRQNLRYATASENQRNRGVSSNNISGLKGAHWDRSKGRWRPEIKANGKRYKLGYYLTAEEAAEAYAEAAKKLHGEFAAYWNSELKSPSSSQVVCK